MISSRPREESRAGTERKLQKKRERTKRKRSHRTVIWLTPSDTDACLCVNVQGCRSISSPPLLLSLSLSLFILLYFSPLPAILVAKCAGISSSYLPRFLTRGNKSLRKSCDTPASRPNDFPFRSLARSFSTGAVETISTCPAARCAHPPTLYPPSTAPARVHISAPSFLFSPGTHAVLCIKGPRPFSIRVLFHFFFFSFSSFLSSPCYRFLLSSWLRGS